MFLRPARHAPQFVTLQTTAPKTKPAQNSSHTESLCRVFHSAHCAGKSNTQSRSTKHLHRGTAVSVPNNRKKASPQVGNRSLPKGDLICNYTALLAFLALGYVLLPWDCKAQGSAKIAATQTSSMRCGLVMHSTCPILAGTGCNIHLVPTNVLCPSLRQLADTWS